MDARELAEKFSAKVATAATELHHQETVVTISPISVVVMSRLLALIVDDDLLVRLNAAFLLEDAGFDALEAGTADEAVGLLEARRTSRSSSRH